MGAAAVGTTISAYAVARLMMNLPAGILADCYGRKPLLVWGPLITALGMWHPTQNLHSVAVRAMPALVHSGISHAGRLRWQLEASPAAVPS